jgi:flagellar FliJ protein
MQSILNIKLKLEEQAKNDFARARRALDEEEARLAALYLRKEDYLEEGRRLQSAALHVQEIIDNKNFVIIIDLYIDRQKLAVKRAEDQLEIARQKMNEAIKERKTYERLREKAFEDFLHEEKISEMKDVDAVTSYTHAAMRGYV